MQDMVDHIPLISKIASTAVVVGIVIGIAYRRRPPVHMPIMISCFAVDVINVVVIELNRGAIQQSIEAATTDIDWLLNFHVIVSVLSILCYTIAMVTGIRLYRRGRGRKFHKTNAVVFIVVRLLNYVTSFFVGV